MPHINKRYDFVVTVFIVHKHKVLLVHHPRYDKWIPMGGHIELDEDPDEALFREIKEETGLEVKILNTKPKITHHGTKFLYTPSYIDVHDANPPHKHIALVYFAVAKNNNHVLSDEHLDIHWLGINDLENPNYSLSDSIKFYCQEAIKAADFKQ
jgi:8-oxo-dGTP pyrophosphatase MutT (NUDIX family)